MLLCISLCLILCMLHSFFIFSLYSELLFTSSIFVIPRSNMHYLFSFPLGLLNFLPSFFLLHFEKGDPIGKQTSIISRFFLIDSCSFNCLSHIVFIVTIVLIAILIWRALVIILWLFLLLGNGLSLFRGLDIVLGVHNP